MKSATRRAHDQGVNLVGARKTEFEVHDRHDECGRRRIVPGLGHDVHSHGQQWQLAPTMDFTSAKKVEAPLGGQDNSFQYLSSFLPNDGVRPNLLKGR
jgi:hypothetical protein